MIELTCPHCGFTKNVPEKSLPTRVTRITCPRCQESFAHVQEDLPLAPEPERVASVLDMEEALNGGFWVRAVALGLDLALLLAVRTVLGLFLGLGIDLVGGGTHPLVDLILSLFGLVLGLAYFVFFTGYCGQTPGKMALRLKVVRSSGGELGFAGAMLREVVGKTFSLLTSLILFNGYLLAAFHPQKRALHDLIADTYVIKL